MKRDKYLDLARELKDMEHRGDADTNCNWCAWNSPQKLGKVAGRAETIPTTALKSTRKLRRLLENCGTCCHSDSSKRSPANTE